MQQSPGLFSQEANPESAGAFGTLSAGELLFLVPRFTNNARATMRGRCSARAASLRNHLKDEFEQGGKLVPENPKDEGEKLVPVQPKDGTDGHDALGLRGAGTRGALDQRLDNKVLLCTGQVLAVQNPFDPRRESHDFWTTGANGMKHGAESM